MKKRICLSGKNRTELDDSLRELYGFGIREFEDSLFAVHCLFREARDILNMIDKRIEKLNTIKEKVYKSADGYLKQIGFYSYMKPQIEQGRYQISQIMFGLSPFYIVVDQQIEQYKRLRTSYQSLAKADSMTLMAQSVFPSEGVKEIALIVLVLSRAMTRGRYIDWSRMADLLLYFSNILRDSGIEGLITKKSEWFNSVENIRQMYNRYRNITEYSFASMLIYHVYFKHELSYQKGADNPIAELVKFENLRKAQNESGITLINRLMIKALFYSVSQPS